jgi:hypothetical protein
MHEPVVRRSRQGRTGQDQEHSALHRVTTAQHDNRIDGTPVVPRSDEYQLVFGIGRVLATRLYTRLYTV